MAAKSHVGKDLVRKVSESKNEHARKIEKAPYFVEIRCFFGIVNKRAHYYDAQY